MALSNVVVGGRTFEGPSNTQMEPSRPTVRCYPVATARGSFATVGPTNETREYESTRTKKRSHLAAPRIGVIRITSGSDSREHGTLGRRRAVAFLVGWLGQLVHEPSVRPCFAIERRGCPIASASGSHVVARPHGGASVA